MRNKFFSFIKSVAKPLLILCLALTLVFSQADFALAARAGGRIGGGSFGAPRSYVRPGPSTRAPGGGGFYPGGGIGFPFLLPFFGFGGFGGLFSILIFITVANFLVRSFRNAQFGNEDEYGVSSPQVSVARLQVGLLADARNLQADLNRIAETANTSTKEGLTQVLQEATLSLLRHPEYWIYGASESRQARLESAEAEFNRLALIERSKFSEESVSNYNNQLKRAGDRPSSSSDLAKSGTAALAEAPGEYIIATVLVATQGKLNLPSISSDQDLRRALSQIGSVSSDDLLAIEILWTPQAEGETLSADEVVAEYPNLQRL
jgi:uncharacterized membrane protein